MCARLKKVDSSAFGEIFPRIKYLTYFTILRI